VSIWLGEPETGAGSLALGSYQYGVTFEVGGVESRMILSPIITVTTGQDKITLTDIPVISIDGVKRNIYRSFGTHNPTDFKFHPKLSGSADIDTAVDRTAEADLGSAYSPFSDALYKNSIMYSEVGKPAEIRALSLMKIFPDDSTEITGILDDGNGILIFKKDSIYKLYTNGNPFNWAVVKLTEDIGCDEPDSLQKVGNKYYFMFQRQIYRYPDIMKEPLSITLSINSSDIVKSSTYSTEKNWYILLCTRSAETYIYVYDEIIGTWYVFKNTSGTATGQSLEEIKHGTDRGKILLGISLDTILQYDDLTDMDYNKYSDNNSDEIVCKLRSKTWLSEAEKVIRLEKLLAHYDKKSGQNITHKLLNNSLTAYYTDTTGAGDTYLEIPTDQMTSNITHTGQISYSCEGSGLKSFDYSEIKSHLTRRRL